MKTYLTLSAIALAAAATLSSGAVMAADPAPAEEVPAITITPNIGVVSDYLFRGISQNNKQAALQGGIDVAFKEGFYVGTWASQVSKWTAGPNGNGYELDLYGGYKTEISGVGVDAGVITYNYPGSKTGKYSTHADYLANTQEAYIGLTYGPATFKTNYVLGKNYFATTDAGKSARGTVYYDLTVAQEIAPKLTASAHAGYTDYKESATSYTKFSYSDYNVGLTYDYEGFLLGAKYYFNNTKAGTESYASATGNEYGNGKSNLYKNTLVFSVLKAF